MISMIGHHRCGSEGLQRLILGSSSSSSRLFSASSSTVAPTSSHASFVLTNSNSNQEQHYQHHHRFSFHFQSYNQQRSSLQHQRRHYTPLTEEEEIKEKARVQHLTPKQKETELRQLNREIAKLERLRGINTGEAYTFLGRYKALSRDYGMALPVWYGVCWLSTGLLVFGAVEVFGVDAMQIITKLDALSGMSLAEKVNPDMGKFGLIVLVNECLEPIRLPLVVATVKPVVDKIYPNKY